MSAFRSQYVTRYMGTKIRLLDFLIPPIIESRSNEFTFVDLMAGTHAVGYAMRDFARVVANDIQEYSFVFGKALIENENVTSIDADLYEQLFKDSQRLMLPGWFTRTYADTYFAPQQCREIETIRRLIREYSNETVQSVLLTALMHAMGHAQSSPGHFAQYMPPTHPRVQALREISVRTSFFQYLRDLSINTTGRSNSVYKSDVHDFLEEPPSFLTADVVAYLDPPYSPAQYSRYYHLLDTVVLDDEPAVFHKGLYRDDRFSSLFCSESRVYAEFSRVLRRTSELGWDLAISYGTHALLPVEQLKDLAKMFYPNVSLAQQHYAHSMQGRGVVKNRSEVLLLCRL